MYVVTFYSFKGGVGRTLALMNVAAELVQSGKTVLIVDFDLEAPGFESFPSVKPKSRNPGIVEFVHEYLETNLAPPVRRFVSECDIDDLRGGKLLLMRSGVRDNSYSARLSTIDWQRLYAERDGYLLFEDLKAQWEEELHPDYVLIDSRTGHTDVGGICTRQLPHAVVACFIPNDENITGLETVTSEIKREVEGPARRHIQLYFVPSNVPNLDDEQRILAKRLREASSRLKFDEPACIIHRYESLSLLDNVLFVQRRPRSRLAREYNQLTSTITQDNLKDRDVVLRNLRSNRFINLSGVSMRSMQGKLDDIRVIHAKDGEVLHEVAKLLSRLGREDDAQALNREAETLGFRTATNVLDVAFRHATSGEQQLALTNMREALELPNADYYDVSRAIQLCIKTDPASLACVAESSAFCRLGRAQKRSLCDAMLVDRQSSAIAETVLRRIGEADTSLDPADRTSLVLALIGQGKFQAAMAVVGKARPDPSVLDLVDTFNYAVAEWGATHRPPIDFFNVVLQALSSETELSGKNVCQACAIAAWAVGNAQKALRFWEKASDLANSDPAATFSAWRYFLVSGEQFQRDLKDVRKMLLGKAVLPPVLIANWLLNTSEPVIDGS
jgi:tetratricopeptide (TPR) repeat protein